MTNLTEPIEIYQFEPLFGKDIKDKIKTWIIKVERHPTFSIIVTLYGYDKLTETRRQINSGKNIGKCNETTHYTQAIAEAIMASEQYISWFAGMKHRINEAQKILTFRGFTAQQLASVGDDEQSIDSAIQQTNLTEILETLTNYA